ncbi:type II toxin-antitoxin system RelB/DinJ family antitoxin [Taurinivorans muris]|jgi:addiction module antitoxin, RelB/DinJ family|uniref:Type II toxin-antitoxin system RelB/DinJ family antitoxin n=1 Tax=Taurinivorans muris TaxID=2787751 RepID=A0ABY5Y2U9_9BACT|nr:type II toxin-antitoxin system RelB/DinJ family antitoxin [Desulfovibrionaceae bacterium LT0009]
MEQSTISIRIDSQLKKDFEEFCKNVGMNMTTAISIFATTVVKEQRIPFEISADPFYSEKNMARLRKSMREMEENGGTVHEVIHD